MGKVAVRKQQGQTERAEDVSLFSPPSPKQHTHHRGLLLKLISRSPDMAAALARSNPQPTAENGIGPVSSGAATLNMLDQGNGSSFYGQHLLNPFLGAPNVGAVLGLHPQASRPTPLAQRDLARPGVQASPASV